MLKSLLHWAVSKGAKAPKLEPHPSQPRQYIAGGDIAAYEPIITLPHDILLTAPKAYADAQYGECFRQLHEQLGAQKLDDKFILCMMLVLHRARGEASEWAPYISSLPDRYDDPLWWSEADQQLLVGTALHRSLQLYRPGLQHIASLLQQLEGLYRQQTGGAGVLSSYQGGWAFTPAAALWARSAVWSRAFTIKRLGDLRDQVALVPVLDMLDHRQEQQAGWHTGEAGQDPFQFVSLTPYKKGDVLYNNYGAWKPNAQLVLGYGFALPDNPRDDYHISIASAAERRTQGPAGSSSEDEEDEEDDDPVRQCQQQAEEQQRQVVLQRWGLSSEHDVSLQQPLPQALLASMAVCMMPPAELYAHYTEAVAKLAAAPAAAPVAELGPAAAPASLTLPATASATPAAAAAAPGATDSAAREQRAAQLLQQVGSSQQLKVLVALRQQLRGKLAGMVSEELLAEVQQQLQQRPPAAADTSEGLVQQQSIPPSSTTAGSPPQQQQPAAAGEQRNSHHAQMAVMYVSSQRCIIQAALQQVSHQLGQLLLSHSQQQATPPPEQHQQPPHIQPQPAVQLTLLPGSSFPSALHLQQDMSPGQQLLAIPAGSYLAADSPAALMLQLVIALYLLEQQEAPGGLQLAAGLPALLAELRHSLPPGLPGLIITAGPQQQALVQELLQGTGAEAAAEEAVGSIMQQFAMVRLQLQQMLSQDAEPALLQQLLLHLVPQQQAAVPQLQGILQWQGLALAVLLAANAMERGAAVVAAAAAGDRAVHCLLPLVSSLAPEVRQAALHWQLESDNSIRISAACALPSGTVLSAAGSSADAEVLLMQQGPEALPAAAASSYELCISPAEEDPNFEAKVQLLAASGLGSLHVFTAGASPAAQQCLLAAMALCLADSSSLEGSAACQECLRLHSSSSSSSSDAAAEPQDGFATAAAGSSAVGLAVDVVGGQRHKQQCAAAAARLVGAVAGGEGKGGREARKQLCRMVLEVEQQLQQQCKDARGKAVAEKLGGSCAGGLAAYIGGQLGVVSAWHAALSAGLGAGKKHAAGGQDKQQRKKRAKSTAPS